MRFYFVLLSLIVNSFYLFAQGPGKVAGQNLNYQTKNTIKVPITDEATILSGLTNNQTTQRVQYFTDLGRPLQNIIVQGSPSGMDIIQPYTYDIIGREPNSYPPITLKGLTAQTTSNGTDGKFVTDALPATIPITSAYSNTLHYKFYQLGGDLPNDASPFEASVFENTPLDRVVKQGSIGASWQPSVDGGYKSFYYGAGDPGLAKYSVDASGNLIKLGSYPGNSVYSLAITDEKGQRTTVFTDLNGQKIAEWSNGLPNWSKTYYVYDPYGRLVYILPPEFIRNGGDPNKWCYQFKYDVLGRAIQSKTPGAGWKSYVYDSKDRVVFTQDAVQTNNNDWSYTKYDQMNRPVVSGIYHAGSAISLSSMQSTVDALNNGQGYQDITKVQTMGIQTGGDIVLTSYNDFSGINDYEATNSISLEPGFSFAAGEDATLLHLGLTSSTGAGGKPSEVFPIVNTEDLAFTYYDDYSKCEGCYNRSSDYPYTFFNETWSTTTDEPFVNTFRVKGKTVGSKVKILGTDKWLYTLVYYNRKGQAIQTMSDDQFGGAWCASTLYNFQGQPLEESEGFGMLRKFYTYDAGGRLTKVEHQINSQPREIISQLTYNELGQLTSEKFHNTTPAASTPSYMQSVDTRYNIRGWLTNINNLPGDDALPINDPTKDYFGMDLAYNTTISGNTPRTDGLLTALKWKQDFGSKRRLYNYSYDEFGRIQNSNQKMSLDQGSTWTGEPDFFSETGITYDMNGNIATLSRNKETFNGSNNVADQIDQLKYVYGNTPSGDPNYPSPTGNNGNQLQYVQELSTSGNKDSGFKDGGTNSVSVPDYTYDVNGNLTQDLNKGISNISYYFNNLPRQVSFSDGASLQYSYDAAGVKLSQLYSLPTTSKKGTLLDSLDFGSRISPFVADGTITLSLSSAKLKVGGASAGNNVYRNLNTTPGHLYYVSFDVDLNGGGAITAHANDQTNDLIQTTLTSNGTFTYKFTATTWLTVIMFTNTTAGPRDFYLDNVVAKDQSVMTQYDDGSVFVQGALQMINIPGGRITLPTYANLFANPDAGTLDGFATDTNGTPPNVLLTSYQDPLTTETYVKATFNRAANPAGVFPITTTKGDSYPVNPGETYMFKVLGYQASGNSATLYVKTNTGVIISPGVALPVQNASGTNENWVTIDKFTIPSGVTSVQFGVEWTAPAVGNTFYINRVALYKTDFEYNYFLTDQVGSTRVVLQTNPGKRVYTASMEQKNFPTESQQFLNMQLSNEKNLFNKTPGGAYSYQLNSATPIGPAKSIKVYPGDKIDISAYSYYGATSGFSTTLASSIGATVAGLFGGKFGVPGDPGSIYQNVTGSYASGGFLSGHSAQATAPSAYLNYILFDKDFNPLGGKSYPIVKTAGSWQPLNSDQVIAPELGYIYIYVSYENTNTATGFEVYFDDLKIKVQESYAIQVNSYYPFGMQSYTWLREGETDNAYLFQGKESITKAGWQDFGSRMYYGDLGRWFATDPQNQFASPYEAMGNMPNMGQDPDGEYFLIDDVVACVVGAVANTLGNWDHITDGKDFWDKLGRGLQYGLAGAAGGEVSLYAGPEAGFAVAGALNVGVDYEYGYLNKNSSFGAVAQSFVNGGLSSVGAADAGLSAADRAGASGLKEIEGGGWRIARVTEDGWTVKKYGSFLEKNEGFIGRAYDKLGKVGKEALTNGFKDLAHDYAEKGEVSFKSFISGAVSSYASSWIEPDNASNIFGKIALSTSKSGVESISSNLVGDILNKGSNFGRYDLLNNTGKDLISGFVEGACTSNLFVSPHMRHDIHVKTAVRRIHRFKYARY